MKRKLLFRADGGSTIGMGHISRCLALIEMLSDDFDCTFAVVELTGPVAKFIEPVCKRVVNLSVGSDLHVEQSHLNLLDFDAVVLDGYQFGPEFQKALKKKVNKLVYIDDLIAWHQVADVVINHAEGIESQEYSKEPYTQIFLGCQYAMLRATFFEAAAEPKKITRIQNVLISMGGADPQNHTLNILKALESIDDDVVIQVILGPANVNRPEIANYLEKLGPKSFRVKIHFSLPAVEYCQRLTEVDMIICPASTTALEACAVGRIICTGLTADNQMRFLKGLEAREVVFNLGNLDELTVFDLQVLIQKIIEDQRICTKQLENQRRLCYL